MYAGKYSLCPGVRAPLHLVGFTLLKAVAITTF